MEIFQFVTDLSLAALGVLVAVLAIYLAFRLLGKFAKLLVTVAVIVLVLWLVFSNRSVLQYLFDLPGKIKDWMGLGTVPFLGLFR